LCLATTVTVIYGLAAGVLGGDLAHIALASQLQTWRWLWLSMVMSIILAPAIAVHGWRAGPLSRVATVLLLAAWLTSMDTFALLPAALACICALLHYRSKDPVTQVVTPPPWLPDPRIMEIGAMALAAATAAIALGQIYDLIHQVQILQPSHLLYDTRVHQAQVLFMSGVVPAVVLIVIAWAAETQVPNTALPIGVLGIAACLLAIPFGVKTWTQSRYPEAGHQAFESWRQTVPPDVEVLWPDPPPVEWFQLGRPSYWSLYQMAGMVFSRDVTMIATARENEVTPLLPMISTDQGAAAEGPGLGRHSPAEVCKLRDLKFFASWNDLGPTAYPAVAADPARPNRLLRLYRCGQDAH
jgi:hypothetical protein